MIRRLSPVLLMFILAIALPDKRAEASGRLLAASCSGCHQGSGEADGSIPTLDGRDRKQLLDLLLGYRNESRDGNVMQRIAAGYSEAELDAVAEYLSLKE